MKTKISVWAFNEFNRFDEIIANLGCAPKEAGSDYSGANQVKMVNTTHHFKHDLKSFLNVLELSLTEDEKVELRAKIFKKNGEMRKLPNRLKFMASDFFVIFES